MRDGGGGKLGALGKRDAGIWTAVVPRFDLQWITDLALLHVDRHRVYVHAGVDPTLPLKLQTERTLLWKIYPDGYGMGHGLPHVVHGHHANVNGLVVTLGQTNLYRIACNAARLCVGH